MSSNAEADELITQFTGDASSYDAATAKVLAGSARIRSAMSGLVSDVSSAIGKFTHIGSVLAPIFAVASIGGLIALGKTAAETAIDFDTLERRLAGVVGTFQRAKSVMGFAQHESNTLGLFDPQTLDQAAISLEAFGLRTEAVLPGIEKLAAVFDPTAGGIDKFTSAIGKIAEGKVARAMTILASAGISQKMLEDQGLHFSGGKPTDSPEKMIAGILAVANRYQGVVDDMINSPKSKSQAAANAIQGAFRQAGDAILESLAPAMTEVARIVDEWTSGGKIDKITRAFLSLFGIDGGNLKTAVDVIAGALEHLPETIKHVRDVMSSLFGAMIQGIKIFSMLWAGMWAFDVVIKGWEAITLAIKAASEAEGALAAIAAFLNGVAGNWKAVAAGAAAAAAAALVVNQIIGAAQNKVSDLFKGANDASARADNMNWFHRLWTAALAASGGNLSNGLNPHMGESTQQQQLSELRQINQNTRETLDLRKYALGGGNLGGLGVTAVESHGLRAGRGARGLGHSLAEAIDQRVAELVGSAMAQARRQRY